MRLVIKGIMVIVGITLIQWHLFLHRAPQYFFLSDKELARLTKRFEKVVFAEWRRVLIENSLSNVLYEYMFVYLCTFAFEYLCICRMKEGSDWEFPNKGGCIGRWQWKTTLPLALKALNSLTGPTRCPGTPGVLMMNKNIAMKITFLSASQIGGKRLNYINDPLALIIGYQGIHVPQL